MARLEEQHGGHMAAQANPNKFPMHLFVSVLHINHDGAHRPGVIGFSLLL